MTYQLRNPQYVKDREMILCEWNHPVYSWIPFSASPHDVETHGREIYAELVAGKHGTIAAYVPPTPPAETVASLKVKARTALDENDNVAIRCVKAGVPYPAAWQTYDADLRAIVRLPDDLPTIPKLPTQPPYPAGT